MGLEVKEFLSFTLANGTVVKTEAENRAKKYAEVKFTCDGPRCASRNPDGKPVIIEWSEAQAADDPFVVPDAAWRIMGLMPPMGGGEKDRVLFCGKKCLSDYLKTYVPPLSPREQEHMRKHNEAVEAKKKAEECQKSQ